MAVQMCLKGVGSEETVQDYVYDHSMAHDKDVLTFQRERRHILQEGIHAFGYFTIPGVMTVRQGVGRQGFIGENRQVAILLHDFDNAAVELTLTCSGGGGFESLARPSKRTDESCVEKDFPYRLHKTRCLLASKGAEVGVYGKLFARLSRAFGVPDKP